MSETEEQRGPDEIQRDIDQTREELGDTAEALAAKADVKTRAQERAQEIKGSVRARRDELLSKAKRDELLGKARAAAPESAGAGAQQLKGTAKENPVPAGVAGGFVAGIVVGRILFGGRS